jgi:4'-phosphopantetheinyl transferase
MELGDGDLHVWRIDVRVPSPDAASLLSPDETARAQRFVFERDRRSFVSTRAAVRELLASYLGMGPREVRFSYAPKGKPEVPGLAFNASHAGDLALVAVTPSGSVGVDVERVRVADDLAALARRFFGETENRALAALSGDAFVAGFYSCWTRKEAFVKALGEGLSFELDRAEVSVHPEPARLRSVDGDAEAAAGWTMADVDAGPGYAGCVAADSPDLDVIVRDWAGDSGVAR